MFDICSSAEEPEEAKGDAPDAPDKLRISIKKEAEKENNDERRSEESAAVGARIQLPRIDINPIERPVGSNTLSAIPSKCAGAAASLQAGLAAKLHEHGGRLQNKDKEIALRFVSNLVPVHSTHPAHLDHILRSGALMSLARQAEVMCRRT